MTDVNRCFETGKKSDVVLTFYRSIVRKEKEQCVSSTFL